MLITAKAMENIQNNTICVLINGDSVRNMFLLNDVNEELVLVSNCPIDNTDIFEIKKDELCRCKRIIVIEKRNIFLD